MTYLSKNVLLLIALFFIITAKAQKKVEKKYPSLLWEITGNGLKKPSYLFGTMHVSNKMVFHLSDSFFMAIKNSDVVGLELNSEYWQQDMIEMEKQRNSFVKFYGSSNNNYYNNSYGSKYEFGFGSSYAIKEKTFRLNNDYNDYIKYALGVTPYLINSLLFRSNEYNQDYEENTFLDMYIYQTGKKLGKKSAGMETIFTMEKYTTEAEIDRANEKRKKYKQKSSDNYPEMSAADAYRKGDLDMLDSLDRMDNESEAFTEKFLYQRNDVQAMSMDTIMKKGQSLFVGVGAAHLPGKRGVIEILRRMGYKMRPIKMQDRDAEQRDKIDKIRVPVTFVDNQSDDGVYSVKVPGKLYGRQDGLSDFTKQYADMSNGAYYLITRVPTYASFYNSSVNEVYKRVDSLLYENVPGKILKKEKITKNGYTGFNIINKTRRGDIQRYNIFILDNEVIVFKMSGTETYVESGTDANLFFNSIQFATKDAVNNTMVTLQKPNYKITLPNNNFEKDLNGHYLIVAKDKKINYELHNLQIVNYDFEPIDTFQIMLMEESFVGNKKGLKTLTRKFETNKNYTALNALYNFNDTTIIAKYIIQGLQYYLIAASGINKNDVIANPVLPTFTLQKPTQVKTQLYTDTFLHFTVQTPVMPIIADSLKALYFKLKNINRYSYNNNEPVYKYNEIDREMTFTNDSTNEFINVSLVKWGKYEYWHDSLYKRKLFRDSLEKAFNNPTKLAKYIDSFYSAKYPLVYGENYNDKVIVKQLELYRKNGYSYYKQAYADTGSTLLIRQMEINKDDITYYIKARTDSSNNSKFINTFFETFTPYDSKLKFDNKYGSKVDVFFKDYYSKDTVDRKIARSAIERFIFAKTDIPKMKDALSSLQLIDKDYYDTKNKWIRKIANTYDSSSSSQAVAFLKDQYQKTMDTSTFQNNILSCMLGIQTKESYGVFKKFFLQDPPLEVNSYSDDYDSKFNFYEIEDSLDLAKTLFPEILQLTSIDDYESKVMGLLQTLVDSSKITNAEYESYSSKLLFDAKIALKKQLIKEEKIAKDKLESESDESEKDVVVAAAAAATSSYGNYNNSNNNDLYDYVSLLLPFYETNAAIPVFINKLWKTQDDNLKYKLLFKMIKINKPYPDTLITHFATKEINRGDLYYKLAKINKSNLFPKQYLQQETMARAFLYTDIDAKDQLDSIDLLKEKNTYDTDEDNYSGKYNSGKGKTNQVDSIAFIKKETVTINNKIGVIYIYKYRQNKEDKWRFAFSGLQPVDGKTISYKNYITNFTEQKIDDTLSLNDQIALEIKKMKFSKNEWSVNFFEKESYNKGHNYDY